MTASEFVTKELKALHAKFPQIRIRYEYRFCTGRHIIEVIALSFFENDEDYILEEKKIWDEFESLFLQEDILFISEDSLTEIEHADLKLGYELGYREKIHLDKPIPEFKFLSAYAKAMTPRHDEVHALAA